MPVWLDAIPEEAAKVRRPDTRRWLLFLLLITLCGSAFAFWAWKVERTGFIFWFSAVGLPFCCWGLLFSLRRFAYKAEQVAAASRNREREALIRREIQRGQRCAWILGSYVQHASGKTVEALVKAFARASPVMERSTPRGSTSQVRYAALTDFQSETDSAIVSVVSLLASHVQRIIATLPKSITCRLMLDCDNDIYCRVEELLQSELTKKTGRSFRPIAGKGLDAFDAWLDRHWEKPGVLAAITLSLPAHPEENDADAVTLVLLSNRKAAGYPGAVCLHRPEQGKEVALGKTLQRALLWADIAPAALKACWYSGAALAQGSGWNKACEESGATFSLSKDNYGIDAVLGYARSAAPWLAIIIAASVFEEYGPQAVAAQSEPDEDNVWVTVINKKDA